MEADTWLCTYIGATSEGLRNDEAQRRVDIRETRAELLGIFGGEDDGDFREWMRENCYDLHYAPVPQARLFSFGPGNLWRIATDWPLVAPTGRANFGSAHAKSPSTATANTTPAGTPDRKSTV